MGRLLSDKEIVNKNVQSYIEKSTSEYSRFLEGTPSFVTYFNKNKVRSTVDEGMEDVQAHLGTGSPKFYDKIVDLPIYGIDSISLDLTREDFGLETKYEGSGVILPSTIKPLPNDYFFITYIDEIYLFRINSVINDKLNGKQFYKIEFSFNKKLARENQIELDGQINKEMHVIFEDIGSNNICVLEKEEKLKLDYILKLQSEIIDYYNKIFYDPQFNIFTYRDGDKNLYNQMATNFMKKHKLLTRKKEFMNSIAIEDIIVRDRLYNQRYKMSIYNALEKCTMEDFFGGSIISMIINDHHTPFYFHRDKFYNIVFTQDKENEFFETELIERIHKQEYFEGEKFIENLIIAYFNNAELSEYSILDKINAYDMEYDLYHFIMIPILLFILKQIENKLINKIEI